MTITLSSPASGVTTLKNAALFKISVSGSDDGEADGAQLLIDGHYAPVIPMDFGTWAGRAGGPGLEGFGTWAGQCVKIKPTEWAALVDTRDYADGSHKVVFKLYKDGKPYNRLEATLTFNQTSGTAPTMGIDGYGLWSG